MEAEFQQNGLKGKSTKTSSKHTSKSNPPEFHRCAGRGRGGEGLVEEPCGGFFIVAVMLKLKVGRLYNLLVTTHQNAKRGQWLTCLCPPSQGRIFNMCCALTSRGMMVYSCTSGIQMNAVNNSPLWLLLASLVYILFSFVFWFLFQVCLFASDYCCTLMRANAEMLSLSLSHSRNTLRRCYDAMMIRPWVRFVRRAEMSSVD